MCDKECGHKTRVTTPCLCLCRSPAAWVCYLLSKMFFVRCTYEHPPHVTRQNTCLLFYLCSITPGESGERSKSRNRIHKVRRCLPLSYSLVNRDNLECVIYRSRPTMMQGSTSTAATLPMIQPFPPLGVISMYQQMPGPTHELSWKRVPTPTLIGRSMVRF